MAITLKDVAAHAGVAVSTVSIILNGRGRELKLSTACIKRVHASAAKLGYRSNYHARTLKSGSSRTLGVVHVEEGGSFLAHRFWSAIAAGIDDEARRRGYNLLLLGSGEGTESLDNTRLAMDERRIDALIALSLLGPLPAAICTHAAPTVVIGSRPHANVSEVLFDHAPGIDQAVAHLHELGHHTILAFCARAGGSERTPERTAVIASACRRLGMELMLQRIEVPSHVHALEVNIAFHRARLAELLPLPEAATAVLCWNDSMALALVSLLVEAGVRVPRDYSVVGFDDMHAAHVVPPLTTISHALPEQGRAAVTLALERLSSDGRKARGSSAIVPSQLIVRASTGPPRT